MNNSILLTLGVGIALSMVYDRRTGYGSGGLISAGLAALSLYSPLRVLCSVAAALVIWRLLDFGVKRWGWYGRSRLGWAMLMALVLRCAAGFFIQPVSWIGWVVPGLVAADMQRQGAVETLSALASVSVATAFAAELLIQLGGMLS